MRRFLTQGGNSCFPPVMCFLTQGGNSCFPPYKGRTKGGASTPGLVTVHGNPAERRNEPQNVEQGTPNVQGKRCMPLKWGCHLIRPRLTTGGLVGDQATAKKRRRRRTPGRGQPRRDDKARETVAMLKLSSFAISLIVMAIAILYRQFFKLPEIS